MNDFSKSQGFSLKKAVLYSTFTRTVLILLTDGQTTLTKFIIIFQFMQDFLENQTTKFESPIEKPLWRVGFPYCKLLFLLYLQLMILLGSKH